VLLLFPGNPTGHWAKIAKRGNPNLIGWLLTPERPMRRYADNGYLAHYRWAADNQCYSRAHQFSIHLFINFVQRISQYPGTCLFVAVPDQLADAKATHARWQDYAPMIRSAGDLPLAYVAQDGLDDLPDADFDCLFIGGSTEYKLGPSARRVAHKAKQAGKWLHMGRVNSHKRTLYAWKIGVDSIDGTCWAYRKTRYLRSTLTLLRQLENTDTLF
jgi:hypothetical protein